MLAPISKVQRRLSSWIDEAESQPIHITRRGKVVAVLISPAEYQGLCKLRTTVQLSNTSLLRRQPAYGFSVPGPHIAG